MSSGAIARSIPLKSISSYRESNSAPRINARYVRQGAWRMFRSKKSGLSLTIARAALESIFDECDRYDADETGGRLLGTYRGKGSNIDIKVSGVIGPGP